MYACLDVNFEASHMPINISNIDKFMGGVGYIHKFLRGDGSGKFDISFGVEGVGYNYLRRLTNSQAEEIVNTVKARYNGIIYQDDPTCKFVVDVEGAFQNGFTRMEDLLEYMEKYNHVDFSMNADESVRLAFVKMNGRIFKSDWRTCDMTLELGKLLLAELKKAGRTIAGSVPAELEK